MIKKKYKILIILILVLVLLPAGGYIALHSSKVQTFLIRKIAYQMSQKLNAKFTVESVDFAFFNRVILRSVVVEDLQQDTLLYARKVTAHLNAFHRKRKQVVLNNVRLEDSEFNLRTDSTGTINLRFIIDAIKENRDSTDTKLDLKISKIEVRDSRFSLRLNKSKPKDIGIDFSDLDLLYLNFNLSGFSIFNDTVGFKIADLSFTEKSGFQVDRWDTYFEISRTRLNFKELSMVTPLSELFADHLTFRYNNYSELKEFIRLVKLDLRINSSDLNFSDIGFFAPSLVWFNQNVDLSGSFTGEVDDLKGKNVSLQFSDQTAIEGNFEIEGLPDLNETFIFIDINNLTTSIENMEEFEKLDTGEKLILPESFKRLGIINFSGNFTGFIDDFVTYGKFSSDLGIISTDLSIRPDTAGYLNFRGRLKTFDFEIGELVNS
ncbi:MAG: AsmA family protein, partial [Bacteroidales bacterium]